MEKTLFASATCCLSAFLAAVPVHANDHAPTHQWEESAVPPAPALTLTGLYAIDMPRYADTQLLVDTRSMTVSQPDGVVRYVAVLQSRSGAQSAFYQGIRCTTYEVRTYARYRFADDGSGHWEDVNSDWQPLRTDTRHHFARAIARAGACQEATAPASTRQLRQTFGSTPFWK